MNELLMGFILGVLVLFIIGIIIGWFFTISNMKQIKNLQVFTDELSRNIEFDLKSVDERIDSEIEDINTNIVTSGDGLKRELLSILDSKINKLEKKLCKCKSESEIR